MSALRDWLDSLEPHFKKGGRYENFYAIFEMVDTFLYSPPDVTRTAPHVRDGIDLKRIMIYVWLAAWPCIIMACWNTGYQANTAMAAAGIEAATGWRTWFIELLGAAAYDPSSVLGCFWHGFWYFAPVYFVTFLVGGVWEALFAGVRNHEVNEGFFVTSILFALTLPPTIPLWQVGLGITFGVIIGKEVFGGTGKNFLNPALVGRAFLYFSYPAQMSGDAVWVAVDGFSAATPLGVGAMEGMAGIAAMTTWWDAFYGLIPGSLGETSTVACLIGMGFLLATKVASFRIIGGVFLGMVGMSLLLNAIGSDSNPMFAVPWYWHMVIGGFAFGMIYMATDPVSAAHTNKGRWIFGILVGVMTVLIRVVNPAFPEGIMLAILFANIFAPLIDYGVMKSNIKRRMQRTAVHAPGGGS